MKGEDKVFPGAGISLGACAFGGGGGPLEGCRRCGIELGGPMPPMNDKGEALAGSKVGGGGLGGPGACD